MGLLTALTIAIALITDYLFLPPLLLKLEGKKHEPVAVADTADTPAS
jgi:predicted RND superfamily exporter protein